MESDNQSLTFSLWGPNKEWQLNQRRQVLQLNPSYRNAMENNFRFPLI
jgi:hypothetical protein